MMAPNPSHTHLGHDSNGLTNGAHDAPPSTMAALLINNISTTNAPTAPSNPNDDLERFMREISELEKTGVTLQDEAKLAHQHKLIYVFARAVLELLSKDTDDPFLNTEKSLENASDALDVFVATIKDSPEVLAYVIPKDVILQGRGSEPLWVWLWPRVLTLLGRKGCENLTEKIKAFFHVSFQAVSRRTSLWDLNSFFFRYLQECAGTTLFHLQDSKIISSGLSIEIVLPSEQADISFTGSSGTGNSLSTCNYSINDAAHGLRHITHILSMLVDISVVAAKSCDPTPAFEDYLAWMLDFSADIHDLLKQWRANSDLYQSSGNVDSAALCSVQGLLSSLRGSLSPSLLRKGYYVFSILCAGILENFVDISEEHLLLNLCLGLLNLAAVCRQYDSTSRAISIHLIPLLRRILEDESGNAHLSNDFRQASMVLYKACALPPLVLSRPVSDTMEIDLGTEIQIQIVFDISNLNEEFERLGLRDEESAIEEETANEPPTKRRKVVEQPRPIDEIVSDLYPLLGAQDGAGFIGLNRMAGECFSALSEPDRCKAIELLGRMACGASGHLKVNRENNKIKDLTCLLCDGKPLGDFVGLDAHLFEDVSSEAILTLTNLVNSAAFQDSKKPRILGMAALRRFALHFDTPEFFDLSVSSLAQWCLRSLTSSIRELRLAASRTLPAFLNNAPNDELTIRNKKSTFELLRTFPTEQAIYLQETCVLAWGQIGRIAKHEDLNLVLWNLIQYLGHSNPIISGVAFNEILRLAQALNLTVERLFSPFWDNLAIEVVKGLIVKPQTTQLMADLLGISVLDFLLHTQSYTIPWLVLGRQTDIIKRISQARKDSETWLACLEHSNLVPTMALLMTQNVPDLEVFIMALFHSVSTRFKDLDLNTLIQVEPARQALYLLKAAGDASDDKKGRIRLALQFIAERAPLPPGVTRTNPMGQFLEQHILGIVYNISEVVIDNRSQYSIVEKERGLKAISELVKVGKSNTRIARPQLCACLQAAVSQKGLEASAFAAWQTMLINLDDEDVESMLESTFSMIIQRWENFDTLTKDLAERTLQYLLKDRARLIRNCLFNLPSLSNIPQLSDVEDKLKKMRTPTDVSNAFQIFSRRLGHENSSVVVQALVELRSYLRVHQSFLQASAMSEQPDIIVGSLVRSILDTCVRFNESDTEIARMCAECIGLVGCLDSNRVDRVREQREMVVVSNFAEPGETTDFTLFILEEILVPAFLSTSDAIMQGYFSWVMQELLEKCDFKTVCSEHILRGKRDSDNPIWQKWLSLPLSVQDTLTPFLNSKYVVKDMEYPKCTYPIFQPEKMPAAKLYNNWLRAFVLDLLRKPQTWLAALIFKPLCRAIRIKDVSTANFLLPYLVLHVVAGDDNDTHRKEIGQELIDILKYEPKSGPTIQQDDRKLCIEMVFRVLDYMARWIQEKERNARKRGGPVVSDGTIERVTSVLEMIPSEIIADRAMECKSYSRALLYWEQHIRQVREKDKTAETNTKLLERLQDIYAQIDEPDGIEGISAHLHVLDIDQQVLGHRRAGRWTAAQSWYEIKLAEKPDDIDVQLNLLTCLKESGQHDVLLNYVEGMHTATQTFWKLLPFATEASWATGRWNTLEKYTKMAAKSLEQDFNVSIGRSLLALNSGKTDEFKNSIQDIRERIARSLSSAATASFGSCHDNMLKLHVLTELEMIAGTNLDVNDKKFEPDRSHVLESLNSRLEVLGAYLNDKQYLLGIRRAAMQLSSLGFTKGDIASAWLTSARLARKGNAIHQSFNAVLHASQLGDESSTIEHARLLWREGHHRKAIQSLQGAIESNAFISHNKNVGTTSFTGIDQAEQQNLLTARAHLLLAKWLDSAGQTQSSALRVQYQLAARTHTNWEKGHYYLGRHYNKLLETEKALPPEQQNENYLTGEHAKLVIENYLRSLTHGTKYISQTLPRLLTLWLDLGIQAKQVIDSKYGNSQEFVNRIATCRKSNLDQINTRFAKYIAKMPAYMFYTALAQIVARITHPNIEVHGLLSKIIVKVVDAHPQQALWSLFAVCQSTQEDRRSRGITILQQLRSGKKAAAGHLDIKSLIKNGQRFTNDLLPVCTAGEFQGNRTHWASLSKDLGFNQKNALPTQMAVPVESVMTATLPTLTDTLKGHKAFSRDIVTINSFADEVMVLSSLQKPRKLTARGSDGRIYGLMCKPKDDLRKDQRLMEFNRMINRSLKRDAESSRRQLYIKTYTVTPLNEENGLIEWVDGLKTLRDILLVLYKAKGISPNYREIETYCDEALKSEAKLPFYSEKVLGSFPPVFYLWFVQQFPEPSAWFAARLRYTRSCAVMSMVGTILGLGDRHGENILFEEGNGGTFHVDFNCLFDKGLTFVRPERVPFRLTHNMVDAMGIYGYEGPFRKSSELTLTLLRQHEETLMTILEAFVYDPTLDLLAPKVDKKKKQSSFTAPTAQGVLDTIQRKVRGLLAGESVPLGVEGQVDELIKQATDHRLLAGMYIGWCSFF